MDEIRIYYESLEQGNHFVKPQIEKAIRNIGLNIPIKLIKLKGSAAYYSSKISPIIFWKNPDAMITICKDGIETPLLMIEFSNAVFTEDHELQRFDGLVAAADNNTIYVKISPKDKESQSAHGGNTNFDYIKPYKSIYDKYNYLFYHFDWKCTDNNIVDVDEDYLSCPKEIPEFSMFIDKLIKFAFENGFSNSNWIGEFQSSILVNPFFQDWKQQIENTQSLDLSSLSSSRTEWDGNHNILTLKLNRFGHAMDPERGMLSYYGTIHNNVFSKMIFSVENNAWYKDTPKENEITEYISNNGLERGFDFFKCFELGCGLYNNSEFRNIVNQFESNQNINLSVDLSDFVTSNYARLNKALRTILRHSNKMLICDKHNTIRVTLSWNQVPNDSTENNLQITNIRNRQSFDEDDVTYLSVHNIFRPNTFKIIAVSYPGAQADRVVLVSPGTGRRQQRRYIDIISYLPTRFTALQENKGKYNPSQIQKEITELSKYKNESDNISAMDSFRERYDSEAPDIIKIGVGFWANTGFTVASIQNLDISELDYFIFISSDKTRWQIWNRGENLFTISEGVVNIPETYEVY